MRTLVVSPQAGREFQYLIAWSEGRFGAQAAARYRALVAQAYADLRDDPERPSVRPAGDGRSRISK